MKKGLLLLSVLVLYGAGSPCLITSPTDGDSERISSGTSCFPLQGRLLPLVLEIELPKAEFTVGEMTSVTFVLSNKGQEAVTLSYTPPSPFELVVRSATSDEELGRWPIQPPTMAPPRILQVAPGDKYTQTIQWPLQVVRFEGPSRGLSSLQPGQYILTAVLTSFTGEGRMPPAPSLVPPQPVRSCPLMITVKG